jgi:hypothetical protein
LIRRAISKLRPAISATSSSGEAIVNLPMQKPELCTIGKHSEASGHEGHDFIRGATPMRHKPLYPRYGFGLGHKRSV